MPMGGGAQGDRMLDQRSPSGGLDLYTQVLKALAIHHPFKEQSGAGLSEKVESRPPSAAGSGSGQVPDNGRKQRGRKGHSSKSGKKGGKKGGKQGSADPPQQSFWTLVEDYFRDVTAADVQLLRPGLEPEEDPAFTLPPLGQHYEQVWQEQDAAGSRVAEKQAQLATRVKRKLLSASPNSKAKRRANAAASGTARFSSAAPLITSVLSPLEDENDTVCHVCFEGDSDENNVIVLCERCNVAVHQICYGIKEVPAGDWLCYRCSGPDPNISCVLCPVKGGALRPAEITQVDGARAEDHGLASPCLDSPGPEDQAIDLAGGPATNQHAHLFCAQWIPETYIREEDRTVMNVGAIQKKRWRLLCCICKEKHGACIQCSHGMCATSFHPLCAREARLRMEMSSHEDSEEVELRAYCPKHSAARGGKSGEPSPVADGGVSLGGALSPTDYVADSLVEAGGDTAADDVVSNRRGLGRGWRKGRRKNGTGMIVLDTVEKDPGQEAPAYELVVTHPGESVGAPEEQALVSRLLEGCGSAELIGLTKDFMERHHVTQTALAARSTVSQSMLSTWLQGRHRPSQPSLNARVRNFLVNHCLAKPVEAIPPTPEPQPEALAETTAQTPADEVGKSAGPVGPSKQDDRVDLTNEVEKVDLVLEEVEERRQRGLSGGASTSKPVEEKGGRKGSWKVKGDSAREKGHLNGRTEAGGDDGRVSAPLRSDPGAVLVEGRANGFLDHKPEITRESTANDQVDLPAGDDNLGRLIQGEAAEEGGKIEVKSTFPPSLEVPAVADSGVEAAGGGHFEGELKGFATKKKRLKRGFSRSNLVKLVTGDVEPKDCGNREDDKGKAKVGSPQAPLPLTGTPRSPLMTDVSGMRVFKSSEAPASGLHPYTRLQMEQHNTTQLANTAEADALGVECEFFPRGFFVDTAEPLESSAAGGGSSVGGRVPGSPFSRPVSLRGAAAERLRAAVQLKEVTEFGEDENSQEWQQGQLSKAEGLFKGGLVPEDEVVAEMLMLQTQLLLSLKANRVRCSRLLRRILPTLPDQHRAARQREQEFALVEEYTSIQREARRAGRKEKRQKEVAEALAAVTAAAAASPRLSHLRRENSFSESPFTPPPSWDRKAQAVPPEAPATAPPAPRGDHPRSTSPTARPLNSAPRGAAKPPLPRAPHTVKARSKLEPGARAKQQQAGGAATAPPPASPKAGSQPPSLLDKDKKPKVTITLPKSLLVGRKDGGTPNNRGAAANGPSSPRASALAAAARASTGGGATPPKNRPFRWDRSGAQNSPVRPMYDLWPVAGSDEAEAVCAVCGNGDSETPNQIVFCDRCGVAVHQECYGVLSLPAGPWFCQPCRKLSKLSSSQQAAAAPPPAQRGAPGVQCSICPGRIGAFKRIALDGPKGQARWIHVFCAQWTPETMVGCSEGSKVEGFDAIPEERFSLKCVICGEQHGACLTCNFGHCTQVFHASCVRNAGYFMQVKNGGPAGRLMFRAYCERHSPQMRARAESRTRGTPEDMNKLKRLRVEFERVRLICERILKRERIKAEAVRTQRDLYVTQVALASEQTRAPLLTAGSSRPDNGTHRPLPSRCTALNQPATSVPAHASVSEGGEGSHLQRTDLVGAATVLGKRKEDGEDVAEPSSPRQRKHKKHKKHRERSEKGERLMTPHEASAQNSRLPKGYAYVPINAFAKAMPVQLPSLEPVGPNPPAL